MKVLPLLLLLLLSSVLFTSSNTGIEIHFKHESLYIKAGWGSTIQKDNTFGGIEERRGEQPSVNQDANASQRLLTKALPVILSGQPEKQRAEHQPTENAPGKKLNIDEHVSPTLSSSITGVLSKAAKESFNRWCQS